MDRRPRRRLFSFCRHEWMHRSAPGRWWLECFKCGQATPGLTLASSARSTTGTQHQSSPAGDRDRLLDVIRAEYAEMPGLRLTIAQAQRLWDLDPVTCERMLAALVDRGILNRGRDATYGWAESDARPLLLRRGTRFDAVAANG